MADIDQLTRENIPQIFGQDAAELEDIDRLKSFFVLNDSYEQVRVAHPVSLIVGQRGIGKTALLSMASHEDTLHDRANLFLQGSKILSLSEATSRAAVAIEAFRELIERSILTEMVDSLCTGATERLPIPAHAKNLLSRIVSLAASVTANENAVVKRNARECMPWILKEIPSFTVYIDNIDVEWDGSPAAAATISNLIHACYLISADSKTKTRFKISIRSDLYNYIAAHADYMEKIHSGIVRCRWSNDQVLRVVAKRIAVFFGRGFSDSEDLTQAQVYDVFFDGLFEQRFLGEGAWKNTEMRQVLLSFVRQRPRDLISFCTLAALRAAGQKKKIGTSHVDAIISDYSQVRLDETVKEFKSEVPEIGFLLREMRPRAYQKGVPRFRFSHEEMKARIAEIMGRKAIRFSYKQMPPTASELIEFLFKINFLVATRDANGFVDRRYYDFASDIRGEVDLGRWGWEVHMAYRWAIKRSEDDFWAQIQE